jgi:hypothetical protein
MGTRPGNARPGQQNAGSNNGESTGANRFRRS